MKYFTSKLNRLNLLRVFHKFLHKIVKSAKINYYISIQSLFIKPENFGF